MDVEQVKIRMEKSIDSLIRDLAKIRTGVATPAMLDNVKVDYYGTPTPISHLANITVPEPRAILIQPFEKAMLGPIDKAILMSDLGLNPANDGNTIRLSLPILTTERRKELAKKARAVGEEGKISVRNIRRDENEHLKKEAKNDASTLSEDQINDLKEEIQKITDQYIAKLDVIIQDKEKDITEV